MKVTQYITAENLRFSPREVYPSVNMDGAIKLSLGKEIGNDFLGFGVAITGSSCYELNTMQPDDRTELLKRIYTKEGLGLSVGRLSVGSSDYSAELYSYDDVDGDISLEHFSIDRDKAYIIPMIKEIIKINPDIYLYASPWSPPAWMKTGGSLCGGYMRREYIDCYAEYIVKYLKAYAECGINIRALTPQNETEQKQHGLMPACDWHPDIEAEFISVLRKKLDENGMDVKIWMYDYNFDGVPRVKWCLDNHKALLDDCDGIAFHYYRGSIEQTDVLKQAYPNMKMHFTEGGPRLFDNYGTDWCKWSIMMSKVLNHGFGSFTGWNLMLDETGGPNIGPYFCGGLVTLNSQSGELSYSGQYKALRAISGFMQKGATVYQTVLEDNFIGMFRYPQKDAPMTAAAFRNPDGDLVYILTNPDKSSKKQVQFFEGGTWWYVELLPDTVSTIVVKK